MFRHTPESIGLKRLMAIASLIAVPVRDTALTCRSLDSFLSSSICLLLHSVCHLIFSYLLLSFRFVFRLRASQVSLGALWTLKKRCLTSDDSHPVALSLSSLVPLSVASSVSEIIFLTLSPLFSPSQQLIRSTNRDQLVSTRRNCAEPKRCTSSPNGQIRESSRKA